MKQIQAMWLSYLVIISIIFGFTLSSYSQCLQTVSFTNWETTGDAQAGNQWQLGANDTSVISQTNSTFPQFYVGPDTFINVKITGKFKVEDFTDDDYVGFVFGFKETWDNDWINNDSMHHEYYLFDWKKNFQNWLGYVAQEGFSINEVDRTFARTNPDVFPSFWDHINSANFQVLNTQFGVTQGWVTNQTYDFELYYTPTRAIVTIDADTIFDEGGCFEPGLFGFYSFSQRLTRYWDFNYELFIDFAMDAEDVCIGDTAKFIYIDTGSCNGASVFSNIDTFYWDLGDGTITSDTNPNHIYDSAGYYTTYLIATDINGCTDTASKVVSIHEIPEAELVFSDVCLGDSARFYDSTNISVGSIVNWDWDFGNGSTDTSENSATNWYTQSGTYTVQLKVEDNAGCVDSTDSTITIYDIPVASFTFQDTCDGLDLWMYDQSTTVNGSITNTFWDIDDDDVIEYQDTGVISHLFNSDGSYTVQLIVVDSLGCEDSLNHQVIVYPGPVADFVAPSRCPDSAMVFFDSSSVANGQITQWAWNFGGEGTANIPSPEHQFNAPGAKSVKLTISSSGGCSDSIVKSVLVYHNPISNFEAAARCQDLNVNFKQLSSSFSGQLIEWSWDFGNGDISSNPLPLYAYNTPGIYPISLRVKSEYGCKDTMMDSIRIYPAPEALFAWDNGVCEGDELGLYDQSTVEGNTPGGDFIAQWDWKINGATHTAPNPIYTTSQFEAIKARLIVFTNYGCKDSITRFPEIHPIPIAKFKIDVGCEDAHTAYVDESEVSKGIVNDWYWEFEDGTFSNRFNPEFLYDTPGEKWVKLTVGTNQGCESEITQSHLVPPRPRAKFLLTPALGCSPLMTNALNQSEVLNGELTYKWSINDVVVSKDESPVLRFLNDTLAPKSYDVGLRVKSEDGCIDTLVRDSAVTVLPVPKSRFDVLNEHIDMFDPIVNFENNSLHSIRWHWDFGNGSTSLDFAPQHIYRESGTYDVHLISWNTFNCSDTSQNIIEVEPVTTLYVPTAFTPNGDGDNDLFGVDGFNEGNRFKIIIWDRWGKTMYESDDFGFLWDGKMSDNRLAPTDVYVYQILFQRSTGEFEEIHGQVSLVR